jgi:hypothetical protein
MTSAQLLALLDCPATPDNRFAAETPAHWITAPVTDPAHPAAQAAALATRRAPHLRAVAFATDFASAPYALVFVRQDSAPRVTGCVTGTGPDLLRRVRMRYGGDSAGETREPETRA